MKTGEKIARARKDTNMTQDQLAELLEVTRQTISKWESDIAFPETAKIAKLAQVLKVSCDYLLIEDKQVAVEVIMKSENNYVIDWTKVCPILGIYQSTVDCEVYHRTFNEMLNEMMETYNYSLEDSVLILKDLMYKTYLEKQEEEKQSNGKSKA